MLVNTELKLHMIDTISIGLTVQQLQIDLTPWLQFWDVLERLMIWFDHDSLHDGDLN